MSDTTENAARAGDEGIESYRESVAAVRELLGGRRVYAYILTFGCQQNEADSEKLAGMAEQMGYTLCDEPDIASLIVVNTCAVREHAEKKALSVIGQFKHCKRRNPGTVIAVCGCMVSQRHRAEELKERYPYVDLSFGTSDLRLFPSLLLERLKGGRRSFTLPPDRPPVPEYMPARRALNYRAWVSIMYGCDNYCSYCIVPYVRGRERSRSPEAVEAEVRGLVESGCLDITLLGQNVNSYGRGCGFGCDFPGLISRLSRIPGDHLLRFMTSHPKDATRELADVMASSGHVARQFHLPAQSGSDRVLSAMNRGYTADEYIGKVSYIREKLPGCVLTSDIMVGFPGETEEDFAATLELMRTVRFDMVYSFIYSPRGGTPAASMPDQVPEDVKGDRMRRLLELQTSISAQINEGLEGRTMRVLCCGPSRTDAGMLECRTEGWKQVLVPAGSLEEGRYADVEITGTGAFTLRGTPADGK